MIHVVMASDDNYIHHLAVAAMSCVDRTSEDVTLHVLCNNVSEENKRKLTESLQAVKANQKINFIDLDAKSLEGLCGERFISVTMYARYFIPELIPDADKALYLDTDILVRHDISPLWEMDVSDYLIAAALDPFIAKYYEGYGVPKGTPMFNSGVLLMNLKKWRETGFGKKVLDYTLKEKCIDQTALNHILAGNWKQLDAKYNVLTGYYRSYYRFRRKKRVTMPENVKELVHNPHILHTNGKSKLPDYGYRYFFADEYKHYLDMTPWRDKKPTDKKFKGLLRKYHAKAVIKIIDFLRK